MMKPFSSNLFVIFALLLSLLGSAVTITPARAASLVVNSNADTVANDGVCTLREAITAANTDTASGAATGECSAGSGADTITFAADYTITLVGSQLPMITTPIIITGNGVSNTIIQAHDNPNTATYRVFEVGVGSSLTLEELTVRHGRCSGTCTGIFSDVGGGIYNRGNLNVVNTAFSRNNANIGGGIYNEGTATVANSSFIANIAIEGGGIGNTGTLTVTDGNFSTNSGEDGAGITSIGTATVANSTFSNNNVSNRGGGIANGGTLTVTNTTFMGNSASQGGGIINLADSGLGLNNANATISNSTFSGNSATSGNGGGIYTHASNAGSTANTTVIHSTIIGNSADLGGGVAAGTPNGGGEIATIILRNSIVYGNTGGIAPNCIATNTGASLTGDANNLFHTSDGVCPIGASDVTSNLAVNSIVSGLADNGGPTQTRALVSGSPAIDAGNTTTCANSPVSNKDQRGVTRPIDGDAVAGAICDIGAYEYGPVIPVVTASNPSANAVLTSLNTINVTFNQDMKNDGSSEAANNPINYLLIEHGANGIFNTTSCAGGVVSDDVLQGINTASYSNAGGVYITTLTFNSLTAGTYRLFICGTTSIWSVAGLELNNGASDATVDFTISTGTAATTSRPGKTDASSLPKTGFIPNKITALPVQLATLEYAELGDLWLEIPSLGVKSTIVGVPQNADKTWDVTWLGNDTGWLNGTAFPTWNGNSVLTAHVTNASGLDGPFAALKSLKYGDQIIVHLGGGQYVYEVRNTRLARPYSTSYAFESKQDASYLTLITCSGYNPLNESYLFRRVVRLVLVEVKGE